MRKERIIYSFEEYCEDMEIFSPTRQDYEDYMDFCEMNNYSFDLYGTKTIMIKH
ncbi:MAG: hypothetical protein IJ086_14295 [Clostridium sp.]|nr:hypothetical protein [Clostridium sp.]